MASAFGTRVLLLAHQRLTSLRRGLYHLKPTYSRHAFASTIASKSISTVSSGSPPPPFEYIPIEEVECLEEYRSGGYHPISLGEDLRSRYRVVQKLGYGTYSITWLCRNSVVDQYVAVKVGIASANLREVDILESIKNIHSSQLFHWGRRFIPSVLDKFVLHGPNGTHPCYAMAPAMCSISGAKDESYTRLFNLETARVMVAQLILAIGFIHARGIVHGDLHPGNVLLRFPRSFDELSIDQLQVQYQLPTPEPVVRRDGKPLGPNIPSQASPPIWLGKLSEKFPPSETNILLADFGEAFSPSTEKRDYSNAPLSYAPPEARFEPERGLSTPSDIWSLACIIWVIIGQRTLFEDFLVTPNDILADQIDAVRGFPTRWWEKWDARREYYENDRETPKNREIRSLESLFETDVQSPRREAGMQTFSAEERTAIIHMLRSMLSFEPRERSTASQVWECEWVRRWALPELNKSRRGEMISEMVIAEKGKSSDEPLGELKVW